VVVVSEEMHHSWLQQISLYHQTSAQAANENVKKKRKKKMQKKME
jgi:hypothetical protein